MGILAELISAAMSSSDLRKVVIYLFVGMAFLAFMVVDDLRHGRKFQRRDVHLVFWWPAIVVVIFILGLFEFSKITSSDSGEELKHPNRWTS